MKNTITTLGLSILLLLAFSTTFAQKPEMVFVEGGTFLMGNQGEDLEETPVHKVTLNSFYISKYEITNKEYKLFCFNSGKKPPTGQDDMPMVNINWNDAVKYCNWLSDMEGLDNCYNLIFGKTFRATQIHGANGYRIISEAEWEYAANGGNKSKHHAFSGSGDANKAGWLGTTSKMQLHKGGLKEPNELGIFDMTGNCMEWCSDWFSPTYYKESPKENPTGPETGSQKVCRGGNFMSNERVSTNTNRLGLSPELENHYTGIRIVKNK